MQDKKSNSQKFIAKFFPEIMIKGPKAKREMVGQLNSNLLTLLKDISEDIKLKKFSDKIEIVSPKEYANQTKEILLNTSGIEVVLEAIQFDDIKTIDEIKVIVNENMHKEIDNKTFVVRAKRTGTHPFKSTQIEQTVGGYMLAQNQNTKGVSLKNAEVTINLELVNNQLNIITNKHKGLSGFPLGTQGSILSLMSGGFDSTIASYLTIKRGIKTHYIFFNLGGLAHEIGVKQVAYYLWSKYSASHRVNFITIPFEDVVTEIFKSVNQSYMGVMLKRLMLQAASKIADDMKIDALLTGESVAQVSSQTLRNLALIDQATNKLVLRPLSTVNKQDIINLANKIGTRRFAETMPEYCGVISQNPVTHGSYEKMKKEASKFDYDVLEQAVASAKIVNVDEIIDDIKTIAKVEEISDISNKEYTIIDIRQTNSCLEVENTEILKIPFYNLKNEFLKLPKDKQYLLYCDKGILSQLHAQYLIDEFKYENIKVYRPSL